MGAIATYGLRWGIETLFGGRKSRGFNLEDTPVTHPDKLSRLLILIALALLWAFKAGLWLHQTQPIPLKKHRRRAVSLFRSGLDFLEPSLRFPSPQFCVFRLLRCT